MRPQHSQVVPRIVVVRHRIEVGVAQAGQQHGLSRAQHFRDRVGGGSQRAGHASPESIEQRLGSGVTVRDGRAQLAPGLGHVQHRPIGQERNEQASQASQCLSRVR